MAIDHNIPLAVTDGLQQSQQPTVGLGQLLAARKIDDDRVKAEMQERRAREEQQLVEQTFRESTLPDGRPDYDTIVNKLMVRSPDLGMRVQKIVSEGRTSAVNVKGKELENSIKAFDKGVSILQSVYDQPSLDAALPLIRQMSPGVADSIGTTYDKARVQNFINIGRTAQQLAEERRNAVNDFQNGNADGGALRYLKTANSDEEYQAMKAEMAGMGISPNILNSLPKTWSPEAMKQLEQMSVSYKEQASIADQKADNEAVLARDAESRRHNLRTEATAQGNLDVRRQVANKPPAAGGGSGTDAVGLRQARMWRENQLADLSKAKAGRTDQYGAQIAAPLTPQQVKDEEERIEGSFRRMAGMPEPADNARFPRGVSDYVKDIKSRYQTFEEADAELTGAEADLKADHPNLNMDVARADLAKRYGAPPPPRKMESLSKKPATGKQSIEVGGEYTLPDGRRIRVKSVDPKTRKVTDYEVVK